MKRLRILSIASALSAGTGVYMGVQYERQRNGQFDGHDHKDESGSYFTDRFLSIPKVNAASPPKSDLPALSSTVSPVPSPPSNRISEIMKYGFPSLDQIKSHDNFVLSYDRRNKTANWVFEHIKPEHINADCDTDREKSTFQEDHSVHHFFRSTNFDYRSSGFDRGHLAAAANHRHSQKAMDQTFCLSNISPQVCTSSFYDTPYIGLF